MARRCGSPRCSSPAPVEALDTKTPLLRANAAMNKAAKRVLSLLGHSEIAPFFEAANVATDHQQLRMTVLRNSAKKHGLVRHP